MFLSLLLSSLLFLSFIPNNSLLCRKPNPVEGQHELDPNPVTTTSNCMTLSILANFSFHFLIRKTMIIIFTSWEFVKNSKYFVKSIWHIVNAHYCICDYWHYPFTSTWSHFTLQPLYQTVF